MPVLPLDCHLPTQNMWHKPCRTFHPWCPCIKTRCLSNLVLGYHGRITLWLPGGCHGHPVSQNTTCQIDNSNFQIILKFGRHLSSSAAEVLVKFQSSHIILNTNHAASNFIKFYNKNLALKRLPSFHVRVYHGTQNLVILVPADVPSTGSERAARLEFSKMSKAING